LTPIAALPYFTENKLQAVDPTIAGPGEEPPMLGKLRLTGPRVRFRQLNDSQ